LLAHDDRLKVLIEADRIQEKVRELGARIAADYRGTPLTVLGVLKGSVFFLVDLLKSVPIPLQLEFLRASSYGNATSSSGTVTLGPFEVSLAGRHVLVVDDILDSGRTLAAIARAVAESGAASVRTCVLVDKKKPRAVEHQANYAAFEIPDVFIVGYGLDYAEHYRNLPYIAVVPPEVYGGA
jgi:hypoxanthine phosphoribosyltransferase